MTWREMRMVRLKLAMTEMMKIRSFRSCTAHFVCFHNIVMSMLDQGKINVSQALGAVRADALKGLSDAQIKFEAARRLVRHHYQHLVVNQLLDDFVDDKVLKQLKRQLPLENCPNPLTANLIQRLCQSNFQVQRFDMVMQLNNRLMC